MKSTSKEAMAAMFARVFPDIAAALGPENLRQLLDGASLVELAPGRRLMRDRMPVESLYFVIEGKLRSYLEEEGRTLDLEPIGAGQWLGEVSVLSGERAASATVESETACTLIRVHHITFERLLAGNIAIAGVLLERFIALMAERFRHSISHGHTPAAN